MSDHPEQCRFEDITQLVRGTGLSEDWLNEVVWRVTYICWRGTDVRTGLLEKPVRHYAERYEPVAGTPPPTMQTLDRLVDVMNDLAHSKKQREVVNRMFLAIYNQMVRVVYGEHGNVHEQNISVPLRNNIQ